jgi:hypothetical protein
MNLEQIVKETVAKIVAEKQGKDLTGDGKIDSADYLKARSNAIEKAKGLDEASIPSNVESLANKIISWYEKHPNPKMQSDRLPAVEKNIEYLMSKTVGNNAWDFKTFEKAVKAKYPLVFQESQEINEDNEDHEVSMAQSSLNSILRSAMELKAKIGGNEIDIPAWIQDHITNSETYIDQASQGYHEYSNGGEHGEMDEVFIPKSSFDDFKIGDNVTVAGKKAKITNMKMDDESGERRARVRFEDGTAKEVSINSLDESKESNDDKIEKYEKYTYTLDGEVVKPEITFLNNILKAMLGNKIYNIGAPENGKVELTPESGKKGTYNESQQELDEWTISRWQHYAGIK